MSSLNISILLKVLKEWRMFVLSTVPRKVSQAMNEQLTAPFTGDEVLPFSDVPQKGPWPRRLSSPLFFSEGGIYMVMRLVTSVTFSVLFNGERLEEFKPSRGLRQGDPISPYLFLLAAEGLSCLLKLRSESSNLQGIVVAPTAPAVNHLLFVDDSLLFFKSSESSESTGIRERREDCICGSLFSFLESSFYSLVDTHPETRRYLTCP